MNFILVKLKVIKMEKNSVYTFRIEFSDGRSLEGYLTRSGGTNRWLPLSALPLFSVVRELEDKKSVTAILKLRLSENVKYVDKEHKGVVENGVSETVNL
jgi:hypothetical protein